MASTVSKYVQGKLDDAFFTQDAPPLYKSKWQPLFVYGTLKKGFSRHASLSENHFVGTGWTRNTGLTMYRTTIGKPYPVVFPAISETPGSIFGEIFLVRPDTITNLDFIESNGVQYHRQFRTFDVSDRQNPTRTMAAWVYLSVRSIWSEAIKKGGLIQCDVYRRKDKPNFAYYLFKREQEKNASLRNM